jgi:hypothetical protein
VISAAQFGHWRGNAGSKKKQLTVGPGTSHIGWKTSRSIQCRVDKELHRFEKRGRLRLKFDGTRADTSFHLSTKRTSPFK